ncbi:MAG: hypothetical protein GF329_19945 [Candidatus Lokiarchaeota archaeon]|nr:hypothetical protein [Candidatus Lokiarchaeota archaeon]
MNKTMNNKLSLIFVLFIFLLSLTVSSIVAIDFENNNLIIYVDDDNTQGPWDGTIDYPFQFIQDGINASENGYQVFIFNGTYHENLVVNRSISLNGESQKGAIVNGNFSEDVIRIASDNSMITNLTIKNSGGYDSDSGLKVLSNNNYIVNCSFYWTKIAVKINSNDFNIIDNCTIFYNGIGLYYNNSNNNIIKGCTLGRNSIGIHLENSIDFAIKYSYLHSNGRACYFENTSDIKLFHCNVSDNSANHGGIFVINCTNLKINNNIICHNGAGLSFSKSDSIIISNCTLCRNTHFAMWLKNSCRNIIIDNSIINDNYRFGIYVMDDSNLNIENSNICNNYLYSVYSRNSICISKKNYWGSLLGPAFTNIRLKSRINPIFGKIKYFPWKAIPIKDIGANWKRNEDYMIKEINPAKRIISFQDVDTDKDMVPDWWEIKWGYDPEKWDNHLSLDPDKDGLNNVEECYTDKLDSNPFHKDIYLEIDWVESEDEESNKPSQEMIDEAIHAFQKNNINLHIDIGKMGGGEQIPYITNFSFPFLCELYWNYFLHNDLNNPRKGIFHYGIICDYGPDVNFPFFGWDSLDSFLISAKQLKQKLPRYCKSRIIMGGSIHHLGHSLGLLADKHSGIDNLATLIPFSIEWLKYKNYKSNMNYLYKYKMFCYSNGDNGFGDFDDWEKMNFSFFKNTNFINK